MREDFRGLCHGRLVSRAPVGAGAESPHEELVHARQVLARGPRRLVVEPSRVGPEPRPNAVEPPAHRGFGRRRCSVGWVHPAGEYAVVRGAQELEEGRLLLHQHAVFERRRGRLNDVEVAAAETRRDHAATAAAAIHFQGRRSGGRDAVDDHAVEVRRLRGRAPHAAADRDDDAAIKRLVVRRTVAAAAAVGWEDIFVVPPQRPSQPAELFCGRGGGWRLGQRRRHDLLAGAPYCAAGVDTER
mmetsp:Transcript_36958/g.114121  ORF Transcript_36958/g.114121 Transcript_36958/m.114121 type:complete len:243 (+) Transcript_36958:401-1129(+)